MPSKGEEEGSPAKGPKEKRTHGNRSVNFAAIGDCWESAKVSHKRVFALLTPEIRS